MNAVLFLKLFLKIIKDIFKGVDTGLSFNLKVAKDIFLSEKKASGGTNMTFLKQ